MNYLRIANKGLICPEDLILIGSSTKRESTGKIGMFGSGWKYALAWLLRNDVAPKIFSGNSEIKIDFNVKMHRTNAVNVITVDGVETSLTTEMGPKWTGWMAIREILSNAIDEGDHSITTSWSPNFVGEKDKTLVYVPMNGELSEVMMKFDAYFAFNRRDSYVHPRARIFFKTEESNLNIYRKGIRCYDTNKRSKTDFDFTDIHINEDRLTSEWYIEREIQDMVKDGVPTNILRRLLVEEHSDWMPNELPNGVIESIKEMTADGEKFTTSDIQKLGGVLFSDPNALVIPTSWYKKLVDLKIIKSAFDLSFGDVTFIRTDEKNCEAIGYYLKALNLNFEMRSGKCEKHIFIRGGICYVKDDTNLSDLELASMAVKTIPNSELQLLMQ